jgi:hypothetical protein
MNVSWALRFWVTKHIDHALEVDQRGLRRRPVQLHGFQPRAMSLGPRTPVIKRDTVAHQHLRQPVPSAHQI